MRKSTAVLLILIVILAASNLIFYIRLNEAEADKNKLVSGNNALKKENQALEKKLSEEYDKYEIDYEVIFEGDCDADRDIEEETSEIKKKLVDKDYEEFIEKLASVEGEDQFSFIIERKEYLLAVKGISTTAAYKLVPKYVRQVKDDIDIKIEQQPVEYKSYDTDGGSLDAIQKHGLIIIKISVKDDTKASNVRFVGN